MERISTSDYKKLKKINLSDRLEFDQSSMEALLRFVRNSLLSDYCSDCYRWIDQIPLSRPKRTLHRDFADGVLIAEIVQVSL